jgi:acyl-CoA thioesterase II
MSAECYRKLPMTVALDHLLERLDLEVLEANLFRGNSPNDGRKRIFGGLVAGQALEAAYRTVQGTTAHSLHSYFLRTGDPTRPIIYEVDRVRDGKSFSTRRVSAIQRGETIFSMLVSFHAEQPGLSYQIPMPETPAPENFKSNFERLEEAALTNDNPIFRFLLDLGWPIEQRDADYVDWANPKPTTGMHRIWFRTSSKIESSAISKHQSLLAFASDMSLLDNCLFVHGKSWLNEDLMAASLDHTVWFHRPFRADEWLLYVMNCPTTEGSRGFNFGHVFTQDGRLVATVTQESLMRIRDFKKA